MSYDLIPERVPVLRGTGLELRELVEADLPGWVARLSDSEAAALAGDPVTDSEQVALDGLAFHREALRNKEGVRWAIVPDDVGESIGSVGLSELDAVARNAAIGAAIDREQWNRGVATRAGRLVLDYAFGPLELRSIEAVVLAHNTRVQRVLAKLGFVALGPAPAERAIGGAPSLLFAVRAGP